MAITYFLFKRLCYLMLNYRVLAIKSSKLSLQHSRNGTSVEHCPAIEVSSGAVEQWSSRAVQKCSSAAVQQCSSAY